MGLAAQAALSSISLLVLLVVEGVSFLGPSSGEDQGHRFGGEVAALDEPFVVLFDQERAGEADHGGVVGEDADDV